MNSGPEIPSELIVPGGYAPEVLEPAEAAFDDISAFVGTFVEAMDDDTVGFIGDYGVGADSGDCGQGFRLNATMRRRPPVPTKAAGVSLPA